MKKLTLLLALFFLITSFIQIASEDFKSTIDDKTGITTVSINNNIAGGSLASRENVYFHVDSGSFLKVDKEGNILEANLITNKDLQGSTRFDFGDKSVEVLAGNNVTYKNGTITVKGPKTEGVSNYFKYSPDSANPEQSLLIKADSRGEDNTITINGNKISGESFSIKKGDSRSISFSEEKYQVKPEVVILDENGNYLINTPVKVGLYDSEFYYAGDNIQILDKSSYSGSSQEDTSKLIYDSKNLGNLEYIQGSKYSEATFIIPSNSPIFPSTHENERITLESKGSDFKIDAASRTLYMNSPKESDVSGFIEYQKDFDKKRFRINSRDGLIFDTSQEGPGVSDLFFLQTYGIQGSIVSSILASDSTVKTNIMSSRKNLYLAEPNINVLLDKK